MFLHEPSTKKSCVAPVSFHTLYSWQPTDTPVEHWFVPAPFVTVSVKVVLPAEVRADVTHEPPFDPVKFVHVPLGGEKETDAGPFVTLQFIATDSPNRTIPGLADKVQDGGAD